ncbi:MAG: DUF4276 family protein [Candidatus Omnitrophica bacterium]|nr:DUF4276 family protein [Candidatus Omnitrophota bacterium]
MMRVHVICEGQTEETFVTNILSPSFYSKEIYLYPSLIGKPGQKGGGVSLKRLASDARNRLFKDRSAYCTTFFDFYGLPDDFPGKSDAARCASIQEKADCICRSMNDELEKTIRSDALRRFIPYVQMHEFEGLLFSDPVHFAKGIDSPDLVQPFQEIRNQFQSPETINDNKHTAPSKRIQQLYPGYEKPLYGVLAAQEIGLDNIRRECSLFHSWLTKLENLPHAEEGNRGER